MKASKPQFLAYGERAILVRWEQKIEEKQLWFIFSAREAVIQNRGEAVVEVIHTFDSLLIKYARPIKNIYDEILLLSGLFSDLTVKKKAVKRFWLPVCYDEKFALDLEVFSKEKNLPSEEVIRIHYSKIYTLYFMGFLPGFLYLGSVDKSLQISRKKQPRKRVPKGAVGVAENQTGIYPKSSPGGWQIIGNCPMDLFQSKQNSPSIFAPGDQVQFYPVSWEEHLSISDDVKNGKFYPKTEIYGS